MERMKDDCFTADGLLTLDEAADRAASSVSLAAGMETVPLGAADGRIAAADVRSEADLPRFDNSAVDGFAVRHADLRPDGETLLPVRGRIAAGDDPAGIEAAGSAVRIFTGASMPPGADLVVMQEDVTVAAGVARLPPGLARGANVRRTGEDVRLGAVVIPAGRRLRPQDLAVAAAAGLDRLPVRSRLRVALVSTGNELAEPGAPLRQGALHDTNRVMLAACLARLGAEVRDAGILGDAPDAIATRLAELADGADLLVASGGVSVGEEDHVRAAIERVGRLAFWQIAVKPGRSVAIGTVGTVPFAGLPGNPVAAFVALAFLVRPLLARLGGETYTPPEGLPVRAAFTHRKRAGRREFIRAGLAGRNGEPEAVKLARDSSASLTSLTDSDGLVDLPEATTLVSPGDVLRFHPYPSLW